MKSKRAQLTIFVIVAIIIVAGIAGYFVLKSGTFSTQIPQEFDPVYQAYLSCIKTDVEIGTKLLGTQGGYINLPNFEAGSTYSPFSSQLAFFGFGIPYWYYISANGIAKEQVPTLKEMENQLETYLNEKIIECD